MCEILLLNSVKLTGLVSLVALRVWVYNLRQSAGRYQTFAQVKSKRPADIPKIDGMLWSFKNIYPDFVKSYTNNAYLMFICGAII